MGRVDIIIAEIASIVLIGLGFYFIVWGIDLLMPAKYAVVAGVACLSVGLLLIGAGVSLLRTIILSLTIEKGAKKEGS